MKKKYFSEYKESLAPLPNLTAVQVHSFQWIIKEGLKEIFSEFSPINDYTGDKFTLEFSNVSIGEPKYNEFYAKDNKMSYEAPLRITAKLTNKHLNESKEQEIFIADFPLMTSHGTFIINGVERVVVPQLARSFGAFFTLNETKSRRVFGAKIIPARGAWIEIESESDDGLYVRIDRKRKFFATTLLRAFADKDGDEAILSLFDGFSKNELAWIERTLEKDVIKTADEAFIEIYKKLRDGELASVKNARDFFKGMFSSERYDLQKVGRYRLNARFGKPTDEKEIERGTLSVDDLVLIIGHVARLNETQNASQDDIDHLGARRVRAVGEMLQQKLRVGMTQIKRQIQDRMSTVDQTAVLPVNFINPRPLQARLKEFFTTNQLSQFMAQENILSEIEHLRRLSALGPGGLTRERAGMEVRDVHSSHYGRVCPIQSPEGPNIGLILTLSGQARVNDFGVIETPYAEVKNGHITGKISYLNALEEEKYTIAHAASSYDDTMTFTNDFVEVRKAGKPKLIPKNEVELIDVTPSQAFSVAASMIPFLEHNDANRALMGSNMQRQATPCILPEAPIVATGVEELAASFSGRLIIALESGTIAAVDGRKIIVKQTNGKERVYSLVNFSRTNGFTAFHQRPIVSLGDKVKEGQVLADTSSSENGQIALGQNVLVAFMSWGGANYEDAIIISERLVRKSKFTTIHMDEFVANVRDTKLGPEVTTHDIPNVGEGKLKDLDEEGIIRIGAEVEPGDILVGKITPKGETELTPEERLLRSIFGEKARDVKDTSLRMEHGKRGRVVGVRVFSREKGDSLESGIIKRVYIEVAQLRNVSVGDKLAGRHGNKGVIAKILPIEDMPYTADGKTIDVILTPLGVPSRMNLGQILEMHLGLAAYTLGYQAITPVFLGATEEEIKEELEKAGFEKHGKVTLYDGRTGESFEQKIAIGYMYIMKLHHMVEDKIHMRSIGPYSLITQQPLGGKAQGGGQRFGEMEVWALEGYGAANTLREVLTIKSDDILGRTAAFDAIVKGEDIRQMNIPASFNVLLNTLRGLSLDVELKKKEEL